MKLYNHDGVWQLPGTQSKGAVKVDIPLVAASLAQFLNDRNVPAFPVFTAETVADPEPVTTLPAVSGEVCKKCKFDDRAQERWLQAKLAGLNLHAVKQWVLNRHGNDLASVVEAVTYRLSELVAQATERKT